MYLKEDGARIGLQAAAPRGRATRNEHVYERIIDLLIRSELRPGDVIVERQMAELLNASRTPVREALGRLEAERLVYKQPGRGVTVSPFSTEAFLEVLDVRLMLEGEAARLAAGRLPAELIERIRTALDRLEKTESPSPTEIWQADDLLHGAIADATGSRLMSDLIRDLRRRTHVYSIFIDPLGRMHRFGENAILLEALVSGDREGARQAMRTHIEAVRTLLLERLPGLRDGLPHAGEALS